MASFTAVCRLSSRLAGRKFGHDAAARGFRTSAAARAAQNFSMPALSPTMTEGNISAWRVKEGEPFSAGDVLLEIETDKATMDVEAQEDGILMRIMQGDGSKGVQVGTRIAVLAEEGDDISTLEIPADKGAQPSAAQASEPAPSSSTTSGSQSAPPAASEATKAPSAPAGKGVKQTYPLLPSVLNALKENGLDASAADSITPTGPNGRLLKGDVLAYAGKIKASVPEEVSTRFKKASTLDLSNIKVAKAAAAAPPKAATRAAPPAPTRVAVPVCFDAADQVLRREQGNGPTHLTLLKRASDLANKDLPLPANYQPSADELFNQVLGLAPAGLKGSRGHYLASLAAKSSPARASSSGDIIDLLAGPRARKSTPPPVPVALGPLVLEVVVPKEEEKRARVFLERVKRVLETEPARLLL